MKTKLSIFILILLGLGSVGFYSYLKYAQAFNLVAVQYFAEKQEARTPASEELYKSVLANIPFADKFKDYLDVLGIKDHGAGNAGSNSGIIRWFKNRTEKNSCLKGLVENYYGLIKKADAGFYDKVETNPLLLRPYITDEVGTGRRNSVKPGYAWDLALRMSGGDKHLALLLIGYCGHDDTFQTGFDGSKVCPESGSHFYAPKSLGSDVDLSESTKKSIVKVQAPNMGEKAIPAKYYHIMGSAFVSCTAIKEGVPAFIVKKMQGSAVLLYRAKRMCVDFGGRTKDNIFKMSEADIEAAVEKYKNMTPQEKADYLEAQLSRITSKKISAEEVKEMFYTHSAYGLVSKKFPDISNCESAKDQLANLNTVYAKLMATKYKDCPKEWSHERCTKAIEKIRTWITDFNWSEESQEAGADFASKNCPRLPEGKEMDSGACDALKKWNGDSSADPTPGSSSKGTKAFD